MATSTRWCGACSRSAPSACWTWARTPSCANWEKPSASAWAASRVVSPRVAFPLGLNADPRATARTVAIGNAAQTLHPVAGQGLNLGLRDAAVLARLLAREMTPASLERFTSEREGDRKHGDPRHRYDGAGVCRPWPAAALFGLALAALDTVKPARMLLAELMMFGRR
jgi:2-octaprenyl-6-methoxyphenol hydroxylase